MTHDEELAKKIATDCLNFKIYFNSKNIVTMELGKQKWEFDGKSDVEAVTEMNKIFNTVNAFMWLVINEKIMAWVSQNKRNFN